MNRQQKEAVVADFKQMLEQAEASFLVSYRGLTVKDISSLRSDLRQSGARLKVAKARLMKIAAQDIEGIDGFKDNFKDQVGLVFAKREAPAVAKHLINFAQKQKALQVLSGFFESKVLSQQEIEFLASLPSKEVLRAQLAGTLQAPISNFAQVLQMLITRLAYALKQVSEKKEQGA